MQSNVSIFFPNNYVPINDHITERHAKANVISCPKGQASQLFLNAHVLAI